MTICKKRCISVTSITNRQDAIRPRGGCAVSIHFLARVAFGKNTTIVHVILALTGITRGDTRRVYMQRIASDGYLIGVETVGAFAVEGIEYERIGEVAISHNQAIIHPQNHGAPLVYCIEDGFR